MVSLVPVITFCNKILHSKAHTEILISTPLPWIHLILKARNPFKFWFCFLILVLLTDFFWRKCKKIKPHYPVYAGYFYSSIDFSKKYSFFSRWRFWRCIEIFSRINCTMNMVHGKLSILIASNPLKPILLLLIVLWRKHGS